MDSKKTLKPELKEIYERVMNTKAAPRQQSNTPQAAPKTEPTAHAPQAKTEEPYLASSAPRPVTQDTGTFVFSSNSKNKGNASKEEEKSKSSSNHSTSKKQEENSNLFPILGVIAVVFLIIYAVFWAIYFNIL